MNALKWDGNPTPQARQEAGLVHVATFLTAMFTAFFAGLGGMLAAGIGLWVLKDRSAFAYAHAREAFNFNFSLFIYSLVLIAVIVATLGIGVVVAAPLAIALALWWLVFSILLTIAGFQGQTYRVPGVWRVVQ